MKPKRLLFSILLGLTAFTTQADNTYDGIFATYNGSETCYKLTDLPTVTYVDNNGVKSAVLTLNNSSSPILSVELKNNAPLEITYGTYTITTGIKDVNSQVRITSLNGKKYISGGKLILVDKDGNQYNQNGTMIK